MKTCRKCNETKDLEYFYKYSKSWDGFDTQCKSCVDARNKAWQAKNREAAQEVKERWKERNRESYLAQQRERARVRYAEDPEKHLERHKRWVKDNPEKMKEIQRETHKRHYAENREEYIERTKAWRLENPEKAREANRKWKQNNPEKVNKDARIQVKKYRERYPEKRRAVSHVRYAIKMGRLVRPTVCPKCDSSTGRIEAHHPDYSDPLRIVWLCKKCHMVEHRK